MFGSTMLDVAIGLVFVYVVLSLFCTGVNELIARMFRWRASMLKQSIQNLLGGASAEDLTQKLLSHPLITGLSRQKGPDSLPRWVTSATLISALLQEVGLGGQPAEGGAGTGNLSDEIEKIENPTIRKMVSSLAISVGNDVKTLQAKLEQWFDDAMEQVSAWYKRRSEWVILVTAAVICVGLNIDTIEIGNALMRDSALRASVVAASEELAAQPLPDVPETVSKLKELHSEIHTLNLPIGWSQGAGDATNAQQAPPWWTKLAGFLLSIFAVSLGAPFWFDVLNKLLNLRRSKGGKTEQKKE
jgi:hypothetical protein